MTLLIEQHFLENKDRVRIREEAANGTWLALNRGMPTRHAFRMLHSWEAAEDAVQEAYVRALVHLDAYDPRRSFDNWFFIVLTNVIRDTLRNEGNVPSMVEADDSIGVEEFITSAPAPENDAALAQWGDELESVCRKLSKRDSSVLKFYFLYGHSLKATSELLGVNIHTADRIVTKYRPILFKE